MSKTIICGFGTDVDSVAGQIGSYGGGESPSDIQRGVWASEVGVPRLLRLFKKYDMRTSFFIPGHSIETFPDIAWSLELPVSAVILVRKISNLFRSMDWELCFPGRHNPVWGSTRW